MHLSRLERRKIMEQQKRAIKRRRKKSPFKIGLIVLTFLVTFMGYGIIQYYSAYTSASNDSDNDLTALNENNDTKDKDQKETDFNGVENLEKINVLILGVDSKTGEGRTDTIMLAQYDPETGSTKLASIMRDIYVTIPGYKDNKINSAYNFGGPELVRQSIKENFGIDVQYYTVADFDGFVNLVDVLSPNGVEIDVEKRMKYTDNAGGLYIDFQPGIQSLDGGELLEYARYRHDAESDFGRVRRQQQVIKAVKEELISFNGLAKLPKLLGTIQPYIDTNIDSKKILALGTSFLMNPKDIDTIRIPIDGTFQNKRYSHAGAVLDIDREENKQALDDFFSSKQQTQVASEDDINMSKVTADVS